MDILFDPFSMMPPSVSQYEYCIFAGKMIEGGITNIRQRRTTAVEKGKVICYWYFF